MKDKLFTVSLLFKLKNNLQLLNYIVPAKGKEDAINVALGWEASLPLLRKGYQVFISIAYEIGGWACPQNYDSVASYNTSAEILSIRTNTLSTEALDRIISEVDLTYSEQKEIFSAMVEGRE